MPVQILDQYQTARNTHHLRNQLQHLFIREVVQKQAAVHHRNTPIAKRQPERIALHLPPRRQLQVASLQIETVYAHVGKLPLYCSGQITRRGAHIHKLKLGVPGKTLFQTPQQFTTGPRPVVDPRDVLQIQGRNFIAGRVQDFRLYDSFLHSTHVTLTRMDFLAGNMGWIEVVCGPMFSGKSEELIRRLRRAMIARRRVQVFKPVLDDRYSKDEIVSHSEQRIPSTVVSNPGEILTLLDWRTQVIGIDEANFIGPGLVEVCNQLADSGKRVIVAGLDTDYMGRPFPPIPDLLAMAESITKTLAICMRCGNPAKQTQRLFESADLIVVGAAGMYEARCRGCFEAGAPKQDYLPHIRPQGLPQG